MRFYVAGKFEEKEAVRAVQRGLIERKHQITHDWTGEDSSGLEGDKLEAYFRECAERDYEGVMDANAIVLLNHDRAFGAMVEFGIALSMGIDIHVIGPKVRDCIFFHMDGIQFYETAEEFLQNC